MFPAALAAFVLLHIGISATGLRTAIVGRIGEGPYRGLFAVASVAILAWMIFAFMQMRADPFNPLNLALWQQPAWGRHAAQGVVLIGFVLGIGGLMTPGPTQAGFEGKLADETPARGLLRVTRHPFLWGVALWGTGHLLANGERFAPMLFGAMAVMALLGTRSIDRKGASRNPEGWARFAAVTSNIPFAAILQGRNKLAIGEVWLPILVGLLAYGLVGWAHGAVFHVPAFP